jgi:hypothetical protein
MKLRFTRFAIAAAAVGSISACGDGGGSPGSSAAATPTPSPPSASTTMELDTAQVLAQARQTSETSDPYLVNNRAVVLTDTSEITDPMGINGT